VKRDARCVTSLDLAGAMARQGIDWLIVCGCWSEACVAAIVKDGVERGGHVLPVKDACGSGSPAMHETAVLNMANRLYGGAVADTGRALLLIGGGMARLFDPLPPCQAWLDRGGVAGADGADLRLHLARGGEYPRAA